MTLKKFLICFIAVLTIQGQVLARTNTNAVSKTQYLDWWKNYNDEILIGHLQTLLDNNYDLKIAALKTKQAEENIRLTGASQLPQVNFDGNFQRIMRSSIYRFGSMSRPMYSQNNFVLPLNAAYEIDIWGENYLNRKSAKKQKEMAEQEERSAYIYLTSSFSAGYYNLIKACELENNLKEIIALQTQIVNMTEKKYNLGLCSVNEFLDEKQVLIKFEEELNKLLENKKVLNNELIVLLGLKSDKELEHSDFNSISVPETPEALSTTVIKYRPDLISAESYAKKTGFDVRASKREFLPKFLLYGTLGFNAYNWNRMFAANETFLSNIGVAPSWDIFSGGAKLARYRINKYEYQKAAESYEKTVLTSIQEVNDALVETKTAKANLIKSNEEFSIEQKKYTLAQKQFNIGDSSKLDEMKSNVNMLIIKQRNIASQIDNVISTISLYNAVGGVDYTKISDL